MLTMLVLTGLAGKIHSETLSGKERRALMTELKQSRNDLDETVKDLSNAQFNFTPSSKEQSIQDLLHQLALAQHRLWSDARQVLSQPQQKTEGSLLSDHALPSIARESCIYFPGLKTKQLKELNPQQALERFRDDRSAIIRYVRTTTEDVRSYHLRTPGGTMDAYQLIFLNAWLTKDCLQKIEKIKANPNFPR